MVNIINININKYNMVKMFTNNIGRDLFLNRKYK